MIKKHSPTQVCGLKAEKIARDYLFKNGLKLVTSNFRTRLGEIDLIMEDRRTLVFVEVRKRSFDALVSSIESVDKRKRDKIIRATSIYLQKNPTWKSCRFDVVAIRTHPTCNEIQWIQNAFAVE